MKILVKYVTGAEQIHNGKCYFIGINTDNAKAYNIEANGSTATGNLIFDGNTYAHQVMLPKPGVECSNGLYVSNDCVIYYSI